MDPKTMRERVRNRLAGSGRWYDIRNAEAEGAAVVRIYDEIGHFGVTAEDFARDLANVTADEIVVQISSPGGDVFDGVAIFNALRAHPARVTTRVDGVAASIASVIVQAGDHRMMLSGSQMVIHAAWGIAVGPASEMREYADILDKQTENIAAIYAARSGGDAAAFLEMLAEGDTFLSAAQAVELGLADEVVDPKAKAAKASITVQFDDALAERFAQMEQTIAAALKTPPAAEREELTEVDTTEVSSEEAERLLASLTLNKEATA